MLFRSRNIARSDKVPENKNQPRSVQTGDEVTEMGWEVYPKGMLETLGQVHFGYGFPAIYITENGAAYKDIVDAGGNVQDTARIDYLRRHLVEVRRAAQLGLPVRGYFAWSLLDNFEWALGTSKRFGLIHVDYSSQRRTIKESGKWYRNVIETNSVD